MDTGQVLARFAKERQALAMMDHPNVARIFDAGATPKGRPYFVMEYIEGVPITQYCDGKRMILGHQVLVPVTDGKLDLGPWERVHYGEFDGRRNKRVLLKAFGF